MHTIYLGYDHGGHSQRDDIRNHIKEKGYDIVDLGNTKLVPTDDYPDFAEAVALKIQHHKDSLGILLCRSGTGVCIAANKFKGIKASLAMNKEQARMLKQDDGGNVLCLSGDFSTAEENLSYIDAFLDASYEKLEKVERRNKKIEQMENRNFK